MIEDSAKQSRRSSSASSQPPLGRPLAHLDAATLAALALRPRFSTSPWVRRSMNKNLAAASFGSSNDDDEEGGVPTPLVPPSMNPAPSLLNSDFHTDEDSYLQPRPPSAASGKASSSKGWR